MRFYIIILATLVSMALASRPADAEETALQNILVLPLTVSRTGQYAYLNDAIGQMLITRLSRQKDINVVSPDLSEKYIGVLKEMLSSGKSSQAAAEVNADWIVGGSMYSLKDGLQVNLTAYSVDADRKPIPYGFKVGSADEILPAIDRLSSEIRSTIVPDALETDKAKTAADDDGLSSFQTPHPERAYKKGLYAGATLFGGEDDDRFESKGVRKSSSIPITVQTIALGDLDGDGINEMVAASRSKIRVFHFDDKRFRIVAQYDFSLRRKIHVINIADPDESGRMKLFVSANDGKYPASAILTWDGSESLQLARDNIRWYIRPIWWPQKGLILAGQRDSPNVSDNFLNPAVYQLPFDSIEADLLAGERLLLPKKINLFDFVVADLNGDGEEEMMVIDEQQKLLVYDTALNLIWVSSASYGGSKQFFGPPINVDGRLSGGYDPEIQSVRKLVYIAGRLEVKDITGDGRPEVIVGSNEVNWTQWLENIRTYDGGAVACLTWRGSGLMELWRTNHITGYVADYAFDGEGEVIDGEKAMFMNRLYVAQIPDIAIWESVLPGSDSSKMLAYEMVVVKEDPPETK